MININLNMDYQDYEGILKDLKDDIFIVPDIYNSLLNVIEKNFSEETVNRLNTFLNLSRKAKGKGLNKIEEALECWLFLLRIHTHKKIEKSKDEMEVKDHHMAYVSLIRKLIEFKLVDVDDKELSNSMTLNVNFKSSLIEMFNNDVCMIDDELKFSSSIEDVLDGALDLFETIITVKKMYDSLDTDEQRLIYSENSKINTENIFKMFKVIQREDDIEIFGTIEERINEAKSILNRELFAYEYMLEVWYYTASIKILKTSKDENLDNVKISYLLTIITNILIDNMLEIKNDSTDMIECRIYPKESVQSIFKRLRDTK